MSYKFRISDGDTEHVFEVATAEDEKRLLEALLTFIEFHDVEYVDPAEEVLPLSAALGEDLILAFGA